MYTHKTVHGRESTIELNGQYYTTTIGGRIPDPNQEGKYLYLNSSQIAQRFCDALNKVAETDKNWWEPSAKVIIGD